MAKSLVCWDKCGYDHTPSRYMYGTYSILYMEGTLVSLLNCIKLVYSLNMTYLYYQLMPYQCLHQYKLSSYG